MASSKILKEEGPHSGQGSCLAQKLFFPAETPALGQSENVISCSTEESGARDLVCTWCLESCLRRRLSEVEASVLVLSLSQVNFFKNVLMHI